MESRIIQKIENNTKCLTLLKQGDSYEVNYKDGILTIQYWRFNNLKDALERLNILSEMFI